MHSKIASEMAHVRFKTKLDEQVLRHSCTIKKRMKVMIPKSLLWLNMCDVYDSFLKN